MHVQQSHLTTDDQIKNLANLVLILCAHRLTPDPDAIHTPRRRAALRNGRKGMRRVQPVRTQSSLVSGERTRYYCFAASTAWLGGRVARSGQREH